MTLFENEDRDSLIRLRDRKWAEYEATKRRIEKCEALLERLRPVKKEIASLKYTFHYQVMLQDAQGKDSKIWTGEQYESFGLEIDEVQAENKDYYHHSLDHVLDSLNNEITRIENERLSELGLLGDILGFINSISNKIDNFLN